jgi:two-component system chemotaxis response regulator CheY
MGSYRILSVGQCGFDHARLSRYLKSEFNAQVARADTAAQALDLLRGGGRYDAVLVNRVFDLDAARGLDLVGTILADPELRRVPVMLVSNYPEAQQAAVAAGALEGFGKAELETPRVRDLLSRVLRGEGPAGGATLDAPGPWSSTEATV